MARLKEKPVAELLDTWINGNLSDVIKAMMVGEHRADCVEFAMLITARTGQTNDANTFARMLRAAENAKLEARRLSRKKS